MRHFRTLLGPLALLLLCPPSAILVWHTHTALGGSLAELFRHFAQDGTLQTIWSIWGPIFFGTPTAWAIIGVFAASQLALMRLLPGKRFEGPVAPSGHVPIYKANGLQAFAATLVLFLGASYGLGLFPAHIAYDHLGPILAALNVFSLAFCLLLYLKGRFAPSTADSGTTGNFIFDYYWGTELYPRILGWDVKQFTNCRFGMMAWPLLLISYAARQHADGGVSPAMWAAVGIQLVYIAKFFWWETGYLRSLDIMHDRAGYYICWGCLVWVPSVYTSSTLHLVNQAPDLSAFAAALIFALGVAAVWINYWADAQRQEFRARDGKLNIWGREPEYVVGHYVTEKGESKQSLLLASGWWGVARHFHYVPEILGAFFWTLPVGFSHGLPWFYVIFLSILLFHRAFRDDERCAQKYGDDWDAYCSKVRWKIIPGVI